VATLFVVGGGLGFIEPEKYVGKKGFVLSIIQVLFRIFLKTRNVMKIVKELIDRSTLDRVDIGTLME
jgi:hypothetical protein